MRFLLSLLSEDMLGRMPYLQDVGVNGRLVAFACVVASIAVVVFARTPVLRVSVSARSAGLKEGSRGSAGTTWRRFGAYLVIAELATAVVLLVSAGLLGKSLYLLLRVDTGLNPHQLYALATLTAGERVLIHAATGGVGLLQRRTILVAGERWKNVPLINRALDFVDTIFIRRGEGDREALNRGLAVLRAGGVLGLAPEGRISPSGGLSAGHTGIAYLALEGHAPVLPFVVFGQEQITRNLRRLRRTRVHVRIGPPIDLPGGERTAAKLHRDTESVMNTIASMLPPAYRGVYPRQ